MGTCTAIVNGNYLKYVGKTDKKFLERLLALKGFPEKVMELCEEYNMKLVSIRKIENDNIQN